MLYSCGSRFNPRYYYNRNRNTASSGETPLADIDSFSVVNIDPDKDPFKKGDWNKENYKFDGSLIKNYFFGTSFDSQNVPFYKFFLNSSKSWQIENVDFNCYKYDGSGDGNKAQSFSINPANFYKYEGKNPLISYNSDYNKSERMKRFIFYRLKGNAVITLDNYLIAVDTYSKLVFAYGKITKTGSILGRYYPKEFQAVELYGEKRKFYEYDPIGVMIYDDVKKELTLKLYEEYRKEMAKDANSFFPSIHDYSRAVANENGPGLSPYYVAVNEEVNAEEFINLVKGKNYGIRVEYKLYTYNFSADGSNVTIKTEDYYNGTVENKNVQLKEILNNYSAKYGEIILIGVEKFSKLRRKENENIIAELNYKDSGVEFRLRVRGRTYFAKDNSYKYVFSQDGNKVTYYKGNSKTDYTYSSSKSNQYAEYQSGFMAYWGLKVNDYEGIKDGELSWSLGLSPFPGATSALDYHKGYLTKSATDNLLNDIKGREYKNRKGLILYTYSFSSDGKTITYKETDWKGKLPEVNKEYKVDENTILKNKATYTNGTDSLEIGLQNDNYILYKGISTDILGIYDYPDPGPSFLERVAGETYQGSGFTYEFSSDGRTMKCGENRKTYTYTNQDANDRAVYKEATWGYWGLRLDKYGGKNDGVLYWSIEKGSSPGGTQTSGINNYPAYKQTK